MENLVLVIIAGAIIWQGFKIIQNQRRLRKKMRDIENKWDKNITYANGEIDLIKKRYPDLELVDDHRTGLEEANKDKLA